MTPETLLLDVGMRDYRLIWELQQRLVEARLEGRIPDVLILVEHPHVLTLGRRGNRANLLSESLPVYQVERGGDVTYHGPGQLVGYPILKLEGHEQDVHGYLRRIEEWLIRTVARFGIKAEVNQRQTGVWVGEKKLASIGVAIKSWVTYHGFALNVNTDLSYFDKINPCGLESSIMTSLQRVLGKTVEMNDVKSNLEPLFEGVFRRKLLELPNEKLSAEIGATLPERRVDK